jgi:serine/threonine protein kinase
MRAKTGLCVTILKLPRISISLLGLLRLRSFIKRMGGVISPFSNNIHRNQFYPGEVVGIGSFATVREARHHSNHQWYALKEYDLLQMKTVEEAEVVLHELNALKRIRKHPFVTQLYGAFRNRSSVSFVLELFTAGDLRLSLQSYKIFDEKKVAYVVACIGSALRFLHLNRILHRDLKPENIMMDSNGVCKLIDFGMSYVMPPKTRVCVCDRPSGTREYLAPEVFVQNHYHGYESDFWSLGIVMYELLFRHRPYRGNAPLEMICFSRDIYRTAWETLIKISHDDLVQETPNLNPQNENTMSVSQSSFVDPAPLEIGSFIPPTAPDPQFALPLPQSEDQISESCKSLLLSLLDVRIHSRIGTGRRFEDFSHHPWFPENGILFDHLATSQSPIHPDPIHTSDLIFSKFLDSNFENPESQPKWCGFGDRFPAPEIHETIGSVQYVSPEFLNLMTSKSIS